MWKMIKTAFHANHNVNKRGHHYMYLTDEQTQEAISRIKSFLASASKDQLLTLARGDILKTTQNLNQQNNAEILCKNDYALSF